MANIERIPTPYSYSQAVAAGDFVFLGLHRGGDDFPARITSTTDFIDSDCLLMIDGIAYRKNET
jgi:2-iminobutanoate/2-iminopropanoate deaminase